MTTADLGTLRERKRAETRANLEQAALDLALQDGLDNATIEAISGRANVSPRTFFNYFDSKEDAILGITGDGLPAGRLPDTMALVDKNDLLASAVHVIATGFASILGDARRHDGRKELVRRHPHLLHRHLAQMVRVTDHFTDRMRTLMSQSPAFANDDSASAHAEVLLITCVGAVRSAVREWSLSGHPIDTDHIEQRAITLVREVIEGIR